MSQYSLTINACTAILQSMENILREGAPIRKRTKIGALQAGTSSFNLGAGPTIQYDQGDGHYRQVDVDYYQRDIDSDIGTTVPTDCESTNEHTPCRDTFTVSQRRVFDYRLNSATIAQLCDGVTDHFERGIALAMEPFLRQINSDVLTSLVAGVGTNIATGSAATVTVDLLDAASNDQIDAAAMTTWFSQLMNSNQFQTAPGVIAGSSFWRFNLLRQFACCNDLGQDVEALAASAGYAFYHDQMIDATVGADRAIVFEAGSWRFVPYLKYRDVADANNVLMGNEGAYGAFELANGTMRGVFRDDFSGIPFDLKVIADDCDDGWNVIGELNFDVWTPPSDLYKVGDHLEGFNGLLDYTFT